MIFDTFRKRREFDQILGGETPKIFKRIKY